MFECDMLTPTIRFYGEVTGEKAATFETGAATPTT